MSSWTDFAGLIAGQALFLLFVAYRKHALGWPGTRRVAAFILSGIAYGVAFDLVIGKYLGVFEYALGFGPLFLIVNGIFSYGIMMATVWLLRDEGFFRLYGWTILLGIFYEIANRLFPVWTWTFGPSALAEEVIVVFAAYLGLSALMALFLTATRQARFRFLTARAT